MQALILIFVALLALAVRFLHPDADPVGKLTFGMGFLILAGFFSGELIAKISLPRITGYLLAGLAVGPHALGFVDSPTVAKLALVDELALCLIAVAAGGELKLASLRQQASAIAAIVVGHFMIIALLFTGLLVGIHHVLALTDPMSKGQVVAVAALMAVVAFATSPSAVVAVIVEARAQGPVTELVLGSAVVKDLLGILVFTVALRFCGPILCGSSAGHAASMWSMLSELALSFVVGTVFGALIIVYLKRVGKEMVVFLLGLSFFVIMISKTFHLHTLLVALNAGFVVTNFSAQGKVFLEGLEKASAPVFVIFFCIAGASLNPNSVLPVWHIAVGFVLLRSLGLFLGTWGGATVSGAPSAARRFGWMGFVSQAGISMGFAMMLEKALPGLGSQLREVVMAAVVIDQIAGPVAFKAALMWSGEVAKRAQLR